MTVASVNMVDPNATPGVVADGSKTPEQLAAEFDAAQAARSATSRETPAAPAKAERPAHIPEKFWDGEKGEVRVEALAKSYAELEKGRAPTTEKPAEGTEKTSLTLPTNATVDQAREVAEKAGLDVNALAAEYARDGKLSDASVAAIKAKGFTDAQIEAYTAGQQALADQVRNDVFSTVGGEANYAAMTKWAAANMSQAEMDAYDRMVTTSDINTVKFAVAGLAARYEKANGSTPTLLDGNTGSAATQGYASRAQQVEAQKDPRYAKDPAYRAEVLRKIAATEW
jgi:hypothetical protein